MDSTPEEAENRNEVLVWFGEAFSRLHPQLQSLHRLGGNLTGKIELRFGNGVAGFVGRRLARKLGIPLQAGAHDLRVEIRHHENSLYWNRCFDQQHSVLSIFKPVGNYPSGYWLEKTGPVNLKLTVDIIDSAWHWRLLGVRVFGLPVPLMMFPHAVAYKKMIDEHYQFHVSFSMPWLGQLLSYEGRLVFESN